MAIRPGATRCILGLGSVHVDEEVLWVVDKGVGKVDVGLCCFFLLLLWNVD